MRPWSYSRLSTYEDCPKQFWYAYIEQMDGFRPPSSAANRGTAIHGAGEKYLLGELKIYPPEYQRVSGHLMGLKARKATPEQKLAVTDKWEPCDWKDPEAYLRGIIDVIYEDNDGLHIQDFKTGQVYASHPVQMELYVALAAPHYPSATHFVTRLIYIDQGIVTSPKRTEAARLKPIRLLLDGRIEIAETDEIYPIRAGAHCRWCDYSQKYNGPCPH